MHYFFQSNDAYSYQGGIPVSTVNSGQQWDFPYAWPPLDHMIIEGMRKSEDPYAQKAAFQMAQKWIRKSYNTFQATGLILEKVRAFFLYSYDTFAHMQVFIFYCKTMVTIQDEALC
ncbi:unnamed protein product [Gongylonema pulchrum]|uniref:Trehalase n=1 Tax=Gongylonema pulchrum TaxID=637853 RepID=A0A183ETB3_9BILA|nr:unnamed protein product [Gongylonema pulchrum]